MQWLKGISSRVLLQEFPHLRKRFWGRHFWARGYLAVSSGNITDEMVKEYIEEQEGEQIMTIVDFQSTVFKFLGL
jgi:putative transposase